MHVKPLVYWLGKITPHSALVTVFIYASITSNTDEVVELHDV